MALFTKGILLEQHKEPMLTRNVLIMRQEYKYFDCDFPDVPVEELSAEQIIEIARLAEIIDESDDDPMAVIEKIRSFGVSPAIAIKPKTPAEEVFKYIPYVDMVLVMTVEPGFGGQSFMESTMPKIEKLRAKCPELDIQVDGGINPDTVKIAATVADAVKYVEEKVANN